MAFVSPNCGGVSADSHLQDGSQRRPSNTRALRAEVLKQREGGNRDGPVYQRYRTSCALVGSGFGSDQSVEFRIAQSHDMLVQPGQYKATRGHEISTETTISPRASGVGPAWIENSAISFRTILRMDYFFVVARARQAYRLANAQLRHDNS